MPPEEASAPAAIPQELVRAIPRPVRLTTAGKAAAAFALLLAAGAPGAGVTLYLAHESGRLRLERIRREAVWTEAEVIRTGVTRDKERRLFAVYRYQAGDRYYTGRFTVRRQNAAGLRAGSQVAIGYLPSEPARSWRLGHEPAGPPLWTAAAVAAGLAGSALAIGLTLRRQRRLLEEGRAALGRVTRSQKLPGKGRRYLVQYEFALLSGALRSGAFQHRDPLSPGSAVVIIYDPDNPGRQGRYPFSLARVASPQEN